MPQPEDPRLNINEDDEDLIQEGREEQPPTGSFVANAYQQVLRSSIQGKILALLVLCMVGLMFFNVLTTDYKAQTVAVLKSSGASESAIDSIFPPTSSDIQNAEQARKKMVLDLAVNMTRVQSELSILRNDVDQIKKHAPPLGSNRRLR